MTDENKRKHDSEIRASLLKVVMAEVEHNTTARKAFTGWHDVLGHLLEEVEEVNEAAEMINGNVETFKKAIFRDYRQKELINQAKLIEMYAGELMQEALHIRSVMAKAIIQMGEKDNE